MSFLPNLVQIARWHVARLRTDKSTDKEFTFMSVCPRCSMPIEHVEFYSQTGKFSLSGIMRKDGDAVINFGGDPKKEPGFYCPVCGEQLTEDVHTARRILSVPDATSSNG